MKQVENLPREIINKDKTVKFNKKFRDLFKKDNNYEIFGYNLYLEENIPKTATNQKIREAKENLFRKYAEESREYIR